MIYAKIRVNDMESLKQKIKENKNFKLYRRVKIIDLSGQGKTVSELAGLFDLCPSTVRSYIKSYNENGVNGLMPKYGIGCPVKIPLKKEEWEELLHRSPCQFEQLETGARNWTQEAMLKYFLLYHGIKVSQSTISQTIKRLGLKWNRGKLKVSSPDPEYSLKRARIETLKKKPSKAL